VKAKAIKMQFIGGLSSAYFNCGMNIQCFARYLIFLNKRKKKERRKKEKGKKKK
jgi:hypothetical protein